VPKLPIIAFRLLAPCYAIAGEISEFDVATYSLTGREGQPSGIQMRLSRLNGKWVMEGKDGPTAPWKNISCDAGCEYRSSTYSEREAYLTSFPGDMPGQFEIACIQNMVNAFCRLTKRDDASKGGAMHLSLWSPKSLCRCLCDDLPGHILLTPQSIPTLRDKAA
jgi:hypothetical protein